MTSKLKAVGVWLFKSPLHKRLCILGTHGAIEMCVIIIILHSLICRVLLLLLLLLLRHASDLRNCTSYVEACMWVWYCRPPIGAHFHPTPQPPPVPQQLGEKAHLRTVAAVLANATATTLVYPSVQGPAPARRPRGPAGRRRPAARIAAAVYVSPELYSLCLPRVCFIATAIRRSHSSCYDY